MNRQSFKLAWRNIWRNKRRALITIASIAISLFFVLMLRQMQFWTYDFNIKNTVSAQIGYLQITDSLFVDEEILDNSISEDQVPVERIQQIPGVSEVIPRFMSGALTSTGLKSKYAGVLGINPELDNKSLKLDRKLSKGSLLSSGDRSIVITDKMAEFYQVAVGDSLVMVGMGYHGFTAAGIYPVKGIINMSVGEMSTMVYMDMKEAQYMFAAPGRYTQFLVNVDQQKDMVKVQEELTSLMANSGLEVRTWEEVLPGLKQGLELDSFSGMLMAGILYMIVGFGIFGTIVMMYNERQFEFGVMSAIGMSKKRLMTVTMMELLMLILMGILVGLMLAVPVNYYYNRHPVLLGGEAAESIIEKGFDPYLGMGLYPDVYAANAGVIGGIAILVSLYMIVKIWGLDPIKAMRK